MRRGIQIPLGLLALATCTVVAWFLRDIAHAPALPEQLPAAWTGGAPSAWVFVRPGCGHCDAHLLALEQATRRFDPARRHRLLDRVYIVGSSAASPAGAHTMPDTLRRVLGVRKTPTTLLVDASGRVTAVWHGARGVGAWQRAFAAVEDGATPR